MVAPASRTGVWKFIAVSPDEANRELISYCLEKELQVSCIYSQELDSNELPKKSGGSGGKGGNGSQKTMCLIDCLGLTNEVEIEQRIGACASPRPPAGHLSLVLFNVEPSADLESIVKKYKICGLFSKNDSSEIFCKGIRTILSGQLWLSRKMLSNCILMDTNSDSSFLMGKQRLSDRENNILHLIASGASNQEIADKLSISIHTVKTHVYNIYKKYHVSNRIQASLMLARESE